MIKEEEVVEGQEDGWQQRISKSFSSTTKAFKQLLKKDDEYFRSLFKHIPPTERLLDDFSCALQREILVHGRLYVSQNFLCFYSNIFGWETMLTLPCTDVIAIKKEKVAFLIPNAIEVCTKDTNHFFASFAQRDTAFRCLYVVWQNAQQLTAALRPEQLLDLYTKDWNPRTDGQEGSPRRSAGSASVLAPLLVADTAEGGEAGETSSIVSDASFVSVSGAGAPGSNPAGLATQGPAATTTATAATAASSLAVPAAAAAAAIGPRASAAAAAASTPAAAAVAAAASELPVECGCTDHFGRVTLDKDVPCSVETFSALVFADSPCFREIYVERRSNALTISAWAPGPAPDGSTRPKRELTYVLTLNHSIGPKSAKAIELQYELVNEPGARRIVEAEVSTPSVPYGDNFYTVSRYCVTRRTATTAHVRVSTEVRYRKGAPWAVTKSIIERNTFDGVTNYMEHIHRAVCKASSTLDSQVPAPALALAAADADTDTEADASLVTPTPALPPGPPAAAMLAAVATKGPFELEPSPSPGRPLVWLLILLLAVNVALVLRLWHLESLPAPAATSAPAQAAAASAFMDTEAMFDAALDAAGVPGTCVSVCRAALAEYSSTAARAAVAISEQARLALSALNEIRSLVKNNDE